MSKKKIILLVVVAGLIFTGCSSLGSKLCYYDPTLSLGKVKKVIYFQPSIFPEIEEIQSPTCQAFFNAVYNQMEQYNGVKMLQIDHALDYESINTDYIKDVAENNNAEAVIVPHIKYFKVGFGKYVFSNQVLVGLKLYDAKGNFLMETQYDTYKGNARLLGKAENSVKIGTQTAIKELLKLLKKKKMLTIH